MKWLARVAVAGTLSALAVAALTWAGWPRPRSVVTIETDWALTLLDQRNAPEAPHRVIAQVGREHAFWFLAPDGTLRGPWRPGRSLEARGFDPQGRLLAATALRGHEDGVREGIPSYQLARYDPSTGRGGVLVSVAAPGPIATRISGDGSTLAAVASTDPLTLDVYDLTDGRKRTRLVFDNRRDGFSRYRYDLAASDWELTRDGREVLLGQGWSGVKRLGPPGIEVHDVGTGRLARFLPVPLGGAPGDSGVGRVEVTPDGRGVKYDLIRRTPAVGNWGETTPVAEPPRHLDLATGGPLPDPEDGPRPAPPSVSDLIAGRTLTLREPTMWNGPPPVPQPTPGDSQPLPGRFGTATGVTAHPQPGRPGIVYHIVERDAAPNPFFAWYSRQLGLPIPRPYPISDYLYHDWSAGEFRRVHGVPTGEQTSAVGPNDLAILTQTPTGATLTLWDLPPPRRPWPWSVPVGVALGVLATAAGVRLRRRRQPPAVTRVPDAATGGTSA